MQPTEYVRNIRNQRLKSDQRENVERILKVSEGFHSDAGIGFSGREIDSRTIVIESGHQPNFFPHAGTWKKAFLGDYLSKKIPGSIFLFGFADQNLSTAQVLSQSRVPAATRNGSLSIGFKIPDKEKWKTFDSIEKPVPEDFEKEISKLKGHYPKGFEEMEALLRESYERADNLADMNSFIYANLCARWGLSAYFFRYSDVQDAGLFAKEYARLLSDSRRYNSIYANVIEKEGISDMRPLPPDSAPFWLHCSCGGNVQMRLHSGMLSGECAICKEKVEFPAERLGDYVSHLSPAAVSRNIIFAEGLGSSIFISGAGGGLSYGKISDAISKELHYVLPSTLAWKGRDYYLGKTHRAVLKDLARNLGVDSFDSKENVHARFEERKRELTEAMASSQDRKMRQKYGGQLKMLEVQLGIAKEVFSLLPSFIDELIYVGFPAVLEAWEKTIAGAQVEREGAAYVMKADTVFDAGADKAYKALADL